MNHFLCSLAATGIALGVTVAPAGSASLPAAAPSTTAITCDGSTLALGDAYESVQVGSRALAIDTVVGGPGECVGSASTDSANVRVTLEVKHDVASVHIWALHDGFATVNVFSTQGVPIGSVLVSVFAREAHVHKGGR